MACLVPTQGVISDLKSVVCKTIELRGSKYIPGQEKRSDNMGTQEADQTDDVTYNESSGGMLTSP